MKKLIVTLAILALPVLALAQANRVFEEGRIPATSMTIYGNATGSAQANRVWPAATSGGGSFTYQIPSDVCQAQPIEPHLYWAQNGTWSNKTAVVLGWTYQVLSANGHNQASYSSVLVRNNTSGAKLNSTVASQYLPQISPSVVTPGGAIIGTVYRKGQDPRDTAGNATIPIGLSLEFQRCRTK